VDTTTERNYFSFYFDLASLEKMRESVLRLPEVVRPDKRGLIPRLLKRLRCLNSIWKKVRDEISLDVSRQADFCFLIKDATLEEGLTSWMKN
jgi:hypothetical protein